MTRRTWLRLTVGAALVAIPAFVIGNGSLRGRILRNRGRLDRLEGFGRDPKARLRAHYDWLNLDPAAIDKYVADYQKYFGPIDRFSIVRPDFYTKFLLSTSFFLAPQSRSPVKYVTFYDPEVTACFNPVARRPPNDAEIQRLRS